MTYFFKRNARLYVVGMFVEDKKYVADEATDGSGMEI
jgi:hypothetical protein